MSTLRVDIDFPVGKAKEQLWRYKAGLGQELICTVSSFKVRTIQGASILKIVGSKDECVYVLEEMVSFYFGSPENPDRLVAASWEHLMPFEVASINHFQIVLDSKKKPFSLLPPSALDATSVNEVAYTHLIFSLVPLAMAYRHFHFKDGTQKDPYLGHNISAAAVQEDTIIGWEHNQIDFHSSHMQHAETRLLADLQSKDPTEKTHPGIHVYSSLEPCFQCAGALLLGGYGCVFYWQQDMDMQLGVGLGKSPLLNMCVAHAGSKVSQKKLGDVHTWFEFGHWFCTDSNLQNLIVQVVPYSHFRQVCELSFGKDAFSCSCCRI